MKTSSLSLTITTCLLQWPREDEVCELQADPGLPAGDVAHVDEDGVEGEAGLVGQLLLVQQPPQQRLGHRDPGVTPEMVPGRAGGAGSEQSSSSD